MSLDFYCIKRRLVTNLKLPIPQPAQKGTEYLSAAWLFYASRMRYQLLLIPETAVLIVPQPVSLF